MSHALKGSTDDEQKKNISLFLSWTIFSLLSNVSTLISNSSFSFLGRVCFVYIAQQRIFYSKRLTICLQTLMRFIMKLGVTDLAHQFQQSYEKIHHNIASCKSLSFILSTDRIIFRQAYQRTIQCRCMLHMCNFFIFCFCSCFCIFVFTILQERKKLEWLFTKKYRLCGRFPVYTYDIFYFVIVFHTILTLCCV